MTLTLVCTDEATTDLLDILDYIAVRYVSGNARTSRSELRELA